MPFLRLQDRERDLFYTWKTNSSTPLDDPCLVFIHGLGSSSSFYEPIVSGLAASGYTCVALDSHGSGLSKYSGEDGGVELIVQDVSTAISALGISPERTIIVGHSMGGIVASELALMLQVAGAVLLGPVYPNDSLASIFNARIQLVQGKGMEGVADIVPYAATGSASTSSQHGFIRALLLSQTPEGYSSNCRAISNAKRPDYAKIQCPLLILAGSDDKTCPMHFAESIHNEWGCPEDNKKILVLDGVGHWHCIEAGSQVQSAIQDFVQSLQMSS